MNLRSLGLIGLFGGLGGAVNAGLCYAEFPVPMVTPVGEYFGGFSWHLIPAGAAHGSLLALTSVGLAAVFWERGRLIRVLGLPVVGWVSGWISWIPLHLSLFVAAREDSFWAALLWPWSGGLPTPYFLFGSVGLVYYLLLNLCRQLVAKGLVGHVLMGGLSGWLGSLVFWRHFEPSYLSVLHGTIWGSLVGFGVWRAQRVTRAKGKDG